MKRLYLLFSLVTALLVNEGICQAPFRSYTDSMQAYQHEYVATHEVVKGKDTSFFRFFPINPDLRITFRFERVSDTVGFSMKTSANGTKMFYKYGKITGEIAHTPVQLFIYQSKELALTFAYKDYLFLPFTDQTSGDESYGAGRYIDLTTADIKNNEVVIDFNVAYNPYCAYKTGYRCPIPPKENFINIPVRAGEKAFGKSHD